MIRTGLVWGRKWVTGKLRLGEWGCQNVFPSLLPLIHGRNRGRPWVVVLSAAEPVAAWLRGLPRVVAGRHSFASGLMTSRKGNFLKSVSLE